MKIVSEAIGVTVLAFGAISTLAAHSRSTPQRHPLAVDKTPGDRDVGFEEARFAAHGDEIAGLEINNQASIGCAYDAIKPLSRGQSIGLATKSSQPNRRHSSRSSARACAVTAMIGRR